MPRREPVDRFVVAPDPGQAGSLDDLVEGLRLLKVWAGDPSYEWIKDRVNAAWAAAGRPAGELAGKTTVVDCFRPGRRRLNTDLVVAVVQALHSDVGYVAQWRQALQVIGGQARAASQVRVQDGLPQDLAGFTGRTIELGRLRQALLDGYRDGGTVVLSAIAGMAGVGKTQLAIHAGHLLAREKPLDRVLFVNLRGFHPDPAQPPAEPAAVLDGFLRLLGVPGYQIPHDLPARTAAYRGRLAGTHTLVVLDNAADADQVRPLLPETSGCPVLVTSRRRLTALRSATDVAVDVFTPDEAAAFLSRAAPGVPVGEDPNTPARIAQRCGHLPLALGLVTGHIRAMPGWTLTDHADRLDERHRDRRLDTGVELALDLSYQHLPTGHQRLLRLAALHPGHDLDLHAASALADTDLSTTQTHLHQLCDDHLLQQATPGRYSLHDLVRAYATGRAGDEDRPPERHAALTRLFDYYLTATTAAMDTLHPADAHRRPRIPQPATPMPALANPDTARFWLDVELSNLVAVCVHTADHGWDGHTVALAASLSPYLYTAGHLTDALTIHTLASRIAHRNGDRTGEADALNHLGIIYWWQGNHGQASKHQEQAMVLCRQTGDRIGETRALITFAAVCGVEGSFRKATKQLQRALTLCRPIGDRMGEARVLALLGFVQSRQGKYKQAAESAEQALTVCRLTGDPLGEVRALTILGLARTRQGHHEQAAEHAEHALTLSRQTGDRTGEADALITLGLVHQRQGHHGPAMNYQQQGVTLYRQIGGSRAGEAVGLNGIGETLQASGAAQDARMRHTDALLAATEAGDRYEQARAHDGIAATHHTTGNLDLARQHWQHALTLYTSLEVPHAQTVQAQLAALGRNTAVTASNRCY